MALGRNPDGWRAEETMVDAASLNSRRDAAPAARVVRAKADKMGARRRELAEATLETLAELGYARTSLREIAQNSEFSHGVLHYYFTDKIDLICCGVRHYKAQCVTRYDHLVETAQTRKELRDGFCRKLAETLTEEAKMHRLWYDLRAQALFEHGFRADVTAIDESLENMVWRVAARYAELGGGRVIISKTQLYATFDGLFQKHLLMHLSGDREAAPALVREVRQLLPLIVSTDPTLVESA
jgi:AcrR family transcriptional regulator